MPPAIRAPARADCAPRFGCYCGRRGTSRSKPMASPHRRRARRRARRGRATANRRTRLTATRRWLCCGPGNALSRCLLANKGLSPLALLSNVLTNTTRALYRQCERHGNCARPAKHGLPCFEVRAIRAVVPPASLSATSGQAERKSVL